MAQMVAHLIGSEEVTGSIPVASLKRELLKIAVLFILPLFYIIIQHLDLVKYHNIKGKINMAKIKIALDDGHGNNTAGKRTPYIEELGRVVLENEFNSAVVKFLDIELKRCGFEVLLVAPEETDTPLSQRVERANNAKVDLYVSIHYNAFDGKFDEYDPSGVEVYYYPGSNEGKMCAECIYNCLLKGTQQKGRGVKASKFYVLRATSMVAVLSENGFMDNKEEALLMVSEKFQREVAKEHAQGICDYYGIEYIVEEDELTPDGKQDYYERPQWTLVESLNKIKVDSSYNNRDKIAEKNGIENYSGTAEQNLFMLELLEAGKLIK